MPQSSQNTVALDSSQSSHFLASASLFLELPLAAGRLRPLELLLLARLEGAEAILLRL
jgi:hypothetical protein